MGITILFNPYFKPTTYSLLGKVFDVDVLVCSQFLQNRLYFSLQRTANKQTTSLHKVFFFFLKVSL